VDLTLSCLICSDSAHIFDSPGLPPLNLEHLEREFQDVISEQQNDGVGGPKKDANDNLAKFISKRVIWEDVGEYLNMGLKREGFVG